MRPAGTRERQPSTSSITLVSATPSLALQPLPGPPPPDLADSTPFARRAFLLHPRRYKRFRDWLRRVQRRRSLGFPAIFTGLATTLAIAVWLSLSGVRRPSPIWIRSAAPRRPLSAPLHADDPARLAPFALLIAPHPDRPGPIPLELILAGLRRQTAHAQLHSLTLVCTAPSSCPPTPPRVQRLTSLNAFYPPPEAQAVLLLESADDLEELEPNWLANALALLLLPHPTPPAPSFIISSGLSRTRHHHLPTRLECVVASKIISSAELALTPILLLAQPWTRLTDASEKDWLSQSGLPSLRLGLDLVDRQLSFFIPPSSDASSAWKRCEHGLEEMRHSPGGLGLEAKLIQQLDDSLYFEPELANLLHDNRDSKGQLCILLDEMSALDGDGAGWGPIICRFLQKGFSVDVLVVVDRLNEDSETKHRRSFLDCIVDLEILSASRADGNRGIQAESRWTRLFVNRRYPVILFPRDSMDPIVRHVLERKLRADFGQQHLVSANHQPIDDEERIVAIGLPRESMESADWITGLELQALRNWHRPTIDISVITNDRPASLARLLSSLSGAHYYGDSVNLIMNLEQTSDLSTRQLATAFKWNQGSKTVRQRIIHGGLLPAVLEAWYPSSPHDSYGVLLEDDTEVSSQFYGWLKFALLTYRYSSFNTSAHALYGISLYQPQHIELKPEGRRPFNATELLFSLGLRPVTAPYLSQVPCSWGALFFPESWVGFQLFLALRLADALSPLRLEDSAILGAIRSTRWPKSWKKYFIEWVYLRGEAMVYPNFHAGPDEPESLSTNHLERGTHIHETVGAESQVRRMFEVPLMGRMRSLLGGIGPWGRLPKLQEMVLVDLWGEASSLDEVSERGWTAARIIGICNLRQASRFGLEELICRER